MFDDKAADSSWLRGRTSWSILSTAAVRRSANSTQRCSHTPRTPIPSAKSGTRRPSSVTGPREKASTVEWIRFVVDTVMQG